LHFVSLKDLTIVTIGFTILVLTDAAGKPLKTRGATLMMNSRELQQSTCDQPYAAGQQMSRYAYMLITLARHGQLNLYGPQSDTWAVVARQLFADYFATVTGWGRAHMTVVITEAGYETAALIARARGLEL
jgi:hypothetical protein